MVESKWICILFLLIAVVLDWVEVNLSAFDPIKDSFSSQIHKGYPLTDVGNYISTAGDCFLTSLILTVVTKY